MRSLVAIIVAILAVWITANFVLPLLGFVVNLLMSLVTLAILIGVGVLVYNVVNKKALGGGGRSLP